MLTGSNKSKRPNININTKVQQPKSTIFSPSVHSPASTGVYYDNVDSFIARNDMNSLDSFDKLKINDSKTFDVPKSYSNNTLLDDTLPRGYTSETLTKTYTSETLPKTYASETLQKTYTSETLPKTYTSETLPKTYTSDSLQKTYANETLTKTYTSETLQKTYTSDSLQKPSNNTLDDSLQKSYTNNTLLDMHDVDMPKQVIYPDMYKSKYLQSSLIKIPNDDKRDKQAYLTAYEQLEIKNYKSVYFSGSKDVIKVGSSIRRTGASCVPGSLTGTLDKTDSTPYNDGFDDSRGDYYLTQHDHVAYRYEIFSLLGKGSFGQVVKCFDHKTKTFVALKIIRNKKRFEKQGIIEVKVLDRIRKEDADNMHNCVHMLDYFYFRGHLCITFELLGINLYEWLKAGDFRGVNLGVIKQFTQQMVRCLCLLQQTNIIHCDLKPENVLLIDSRNINPGIKDKHQSSSGYPRNYNPRDYDTSEYEIKVIDFGSSCFKNEQLYTYVQSRFYRSPEVILGVTYGLGIDMWSLGCILAELYTGYPLFPGENEQEQLHCIMEVKGLPDIKFIDKAKKKLAFFDPNGIPKPFSNSKGKRRRPGAKSLSSVLKCGDPQFLDFLQKCLEWDPDRRMTPLEAAHHEWLRNGTFSHSSIPHTPRYQQLEEPFQVIEPSYRQGTKSSVAKSKQINFDRRKPTTYSGRYQTQLHLPPIHTAPMSIRGSGGMAMVTSPSRETKRYDIHSRQYGYPESSPKSSSKVRNFNDLKL